MIAISKNLQFGKLKTKNLTKQIFDIFDINILNMLIKNLANIKPGHRHIPSNINFARTSNTYQKRLLIYRLFLVRTMPNRHLSTHC